LGFGFRVTDFGLLVPGFGLRYPELYMTLKRQACLSSKVDEFVPHTQRVDLRIVCYPELYMTLKRQACLPSKVNEFVPQTQHVDLRIVLQRCCDATRSYT